MRIFVIAIGISVGGLLAGCGNEQLPYKILYVNSYHKGYPPSDAVTDALLESLSQDSFQTTTVYLDTKRRTDGADIDSAVAEVTTILQNGSFSALLVSDDAAVQKLIAPNQEYIAIPMVYCGVNWSDDSYQLDKTRVTGMLEVLPLNQLLAEVRRLYPDGKRLWVLSEKSISEDQNTRLLDTLYTNSGFDPTYRLVDNFADWERNFLTAMDSADVVYLPTNGAIRDWDEGKAAELVSRSIRVPVVTCDDFMMRYCVYGLTKVPAEQGQFLANVVRELVRGTTIPNLQQARNTQYEVWYNPGLARKIDFPAPTTPGFNVPGEAVANVPAE